jgi:hypothetical protein
MPSVLTAVWSCIRPDRTAPAYSVRPRPSETMVVLIVFCLRLPETNARRPGRPGRGRRTWGLGGVDSQLNALGGGIAEHIDQGAQPHPGQARHREPACGQQRADLGDRVGDGGAIHAVEQGQGVVWELEAQNDQGG